MGGKVDKTRELYRKFVQTTIFRSYEQAKRSETLKKHLN